MIGYGCNQALVDAVEKVCIALGRRSPEVVVVVLPDTGGYILRAASFLSFPKLKAYGERRAIRGEVASAVTSLVGARDALVFVHGIDPDKVYWWALFNPVLETENTAGGGRFRYTTYG